MNYVDCTGDQTEDCTCPGCLKFRAEFDKWVEDTKQRWAEARKARKVAHVHICNGDCGPLCTVHGDPRDTSLIPNADEAYQDHVAEMAMAFMDAGYEPAHEGTF